MINQKGPIGQLIMMGIPGTDLDAETQLLIKEDGVGNFILFTRNVGGGPGQVRGLCKDLGEACADAGLPLPLIAVDQEGGPVQRLGPPFWPSLPSNQEVALSTRPEVQVRIQAEAAAEILTSVGIGINLAPVLDLAPKGVKGVLKDRSYGPDSNEVSRLGGEYIRTLQARRVWATAKHFPGIGRVKRDPHFYRPVVTASREVLFDEMSPFRAGIEAGVKAMMTSHVVFPALDSDGPATFSRVIANRILRQELGFQGLLMTDDLEMGGATIECHIGDAAVRAALAGHDLLLICRTVQGVKETLNALSMAWSQGILSTKSIDMSLSRIAQVRLAGS